LNHREAGTFQFIESLSGTSQGPGGLHLYKAGIDLLHRVIDIDNILFASEMLGAVHGVDPETGFPWDDTKRYIDEISLPEEDRRKVFELNTRRVYPRLDAQLAAAGR